MRHKQERQVDEGNWRARCESSKGKEQQQRNDVTVWYCVAPSTLGCGPPLGRTSYTRGQSRNHI